MHALACPHCGAPVAPSLARDTVTCAYCRRTLVGVPEAAWGLAVAHAARDGEGDDPRVETLEVGGVRYGILGHLASGESTEAFLAKRMGRVTELVVLRVARALEDQDLIERGARAVFELHRSEAQGAPFFTTMLPQIVALGEVDAGDHGKRRAVVHRWRSGFHHTFAEVERVYEGGIEARSAVWMWRRLLELLGFLHRSGWVHGGVVPEHVLLHPRDHGVTLVGYAAATFLASGEPIPAVVLRARDMYPDDWARTPASTDLDLTMAARAVGRLLGAKRVGDPFTSDTPKQLQELLQRYADPRAARRTSDAWQLGEAVSTASQAAYGPPKFHPFTMPGWP